jgi:tRNA(adenine34) deaminase
MTDDDDFRWMRRAIALAQQGAVRDGANPIGCVIVRDGEMIAEGFNEVDLRHDPTAHAEIVVIRRAAAVRHVHDGLDMGEDRPDRIRRGP